MPCFCSQIRRKNKKAAIFIYEGLAMSQKMRNIAADFGI